MCLVAAAAPGMPDPTNLSIANRDGDSLDIASSSGDDATVPSASRTEAGLQSAADKTKLDGIESGAEANIGEEFTSTEKTKLGSIAEGAEVNVNADWNANSGDAEILNKPTIPSSFSDLSGSVSDAQIPSTVARDSELPDVSGFQTEAEVDARIAPYARATPSGTIADAQIPDDITRDSELTTHTNNHTAHGALTEGDIPAEIARDAEVTSAISTHTSDHDAHGAIVDADIPATIARDTEVDGKITTHNTATDSHSDIRTSIDDKADSSHTHLEADVTDLDHVDLPDAPEALADDTKYELSVESDGTQSWTVAAAPGSPDPTNLAISGRDADSLEVTSSTGTDATIPSATTSLAGLMSGADKTKLENVNSGAEENVQSDWSATEGDALILNKPTTITAAQTTKLAGIEDNATADQTATEIKTAYESNSDTNAYTNTKHLSLIHI